MIKMERLQKVMARAGVASRRRCERLITEGIVKVNGEVAQVLGTKVDPKRDLIEVEGKQINIKPQKVYILLNKPVNYLTTSKDPFGRPIIFDLVDIRKPRLFSVGRLDKDSEGLLLLTNDGELAFRLTHPRYKVRKTYRVEVRGHPGATILSCFEKGMFIDDYLTQPADLKIIEKGEETTKLNITIAEGKKRQVRRMFDKIGHPVVRLKRTNFGPLELGNSGPGEYRFLYPQEVTKLLEAVALR